MKINDVTDIKMILVPTTDLKDLTGIAISIFQSAPSQKEDDVGDKGQEAGASYQDP